MVVRDPRLIVDQCWHLLHASDIEKNKSRDRAALSTPFDMLAALTLVCGRKPIQILKYDGFSKASVSENAVTVSTYETRSQYRSSLSMGICTGIEVLENTLPSTTTYTQ